MKRILFAILAVVMTTAVATAQNYMVVNSEKIFKSIEAYNTAIIELDRLAEGYQLQVDAKFREVENMYNAYVFNLTKGNAVFLHLSPYGIG